MLRFIRTIIGRYYYNSLKCKYILQRQNNKYYVRSRVTKKLHVAKYALYFCNKGARWCFWWTKTRSTLLYSIKLLCMTVSCVCTRIYQWAVSLKLVMKKQGVMDELFNFVLQKSRQRRLVILVADRGTVGRYLPQKLISVRTLVMVMRKSKCAMSKPYGPNSAHAYR